MPDPESQKIKNVADEIFNDLSAVIDAHIKLNPDKDIGVPACLLASRVFFMYIVGGAAARRVDKELRRDFIIEFTDDTKTEILETLERYEKKENVIKDFLKDLLTLEV